jgi:hypothetical protein
MVLLCMHSAADSHACSRICSRNFIDAVNEFYEVTDVVESYKSDIAWLVKDWSRHSLPSVPFLAAISLNPATLADEVAQRFRRVTLRSEFVVPGPVGEAKPPKRGAKREGRMRIEARASFTTLLGHVARNERLNDVVIHAALQCMCRRYDGCFALDPVVVSSRIDVVLPDAPFLSFRCVVVPIFLKNQAHWILQVVVIEAHDGKESTHRITPKNYDPLAITSNFKLMEELWDGYTLPLLRFWHARDVARLTNPTQSAQGSDKLMALSTNNDEGVSKVEELKIRSAETEPAVNSNTAQLDLADSKVGRNGALQMIRAVDEFGAASSKTGVVFSVDAASVTGSD